MIAETDAIHGRFFHVNNVIRQSLTPVNDYETGFCDFSMMDDPWATAIEYMTAQTNRAYSLSEKYLFTFYLIKIAENKHLYYQCSHHIISDGFGAAMLLSRTIEDASLAGQRSWSASVPKTLTRAATTQASS